METEDCGRPLFNTQTRLVQAGARSSSTPCMDAGRPHEIRTSPASSFCCTSVAPSVQCSAVQPRRVIWMSGQRQATRPLARRPAAALESQRVSSVPAPLVGPTHFALHCRRRHSPSPTPPFLATLPRPCLAISSSFCFSPQASTCSPRRRTFASPPLTFPHAVTPPPLQPHRASS